MEAQSQLVSNWPFQVEQEIVTEKRGSEETVGYGAAHWKGRGQQVMVMCAQVGTWPGGGEEGKCHRQHPLTYQG